MKKPKISFKLIQEDPKPTGEQIVLIEERALLKLKFSDLHARLAEQEKMLSSLRTIIAALEHDKAVLFKRSEAVHSQYSKPKKRKRRKTR